MRHPAGELITEKNAALRLRLEDSLFNELLESSVVYEMEFYTSKTASFNVVMSSFGHIPDNGYERDESSLANQLALRQWETVILPSEKTFDRGIYNLDDLGF